MIVADDQSIKREETEEVTALSILFQIGSNRLWTIIFSSVFFALDKLCGSLIKHPAFLFKPTNNFQFSWNVKSDVFPNSIFLKKKAIIFFRASLFFLLWKMEWKFWEARNFSPRNKSFDNQIDPRKRKRFQKCVNSFVKINFEPWRASYSPRLYDEMDARV